MEIVKQVVTSEVFLTVISGTCVYILSQLLFQIWIEPLQKYKDIKSRIASCLVENMPYYIELLQYADNPPEEEKQKVEKIFEDTRKLAAELRGFIEIASWFHIGIPSKKRLFSASKLLIGLSNGRSKPYNVNDRSVENINEEYVKQIRVCLKIYGYNER